MNVRWLLMIILFSLILGHNHAQKKRHRPAKRDQAAFFSLMGIAFYLTVIFLLKLDWPEMQDVARWTMLDLGKTLAGWLEGK